MSGIFEASDLAAQLLAASVEAETARAAYDTAVSEGRCDPERHHALTREIKRAQSLMAAVSRQLLMTIVPRHEPQVKF